MLATVVAVVLLVRRRLAFWVPLVGLLAVAAALLTGYLLTAAGVPAFNA